MEQKSRYYIGIFTILVGVGFILYALFVESTPENPVKKREIFIGAPLLILLGTYRVHMYRRWLKNKG